MAPAKSKALVLLLVLFFIKGTGGTTQNDPSSQVTPCVSSRGSRNFSNEPSVNSSRFFSHKTWCVAKPSSDDATLTKNINYACSMTSCEDHINPGSPCFLPDNLWNHASVAMNLYYQANGRNDWNCHFAGSGLITTTDPSYENCRYA